MLCAYSDGGDAKPGSGGKWSKEGGESERERERAREMERDREQKANR